MLTDLKNWFIYGNRLGWKYVFTLNWKKKVANRKRQIRGRRVYGNNWHRKRLRYRTILFHENGGWCQWCTKKFKLKELTLDHIKPMSQGGGWDIENLQLLCEVCHVWKGKYEQKIPNHPKIYDNKRVN